MFAALPVNCPNTAKSFTISLLSKSILDKVCEFELTTKAEFAKKLLKGILQKIDKIDIIIKDHLIDWNFERLDKVDKQILRVGIYELLYTDTPYQIVIDEAVKLAKNFSEDKAKSFINGILDKVAKENEQTTTAKKD